MAKKEIKSDTLAGLEPPAALPGWNTAADAKYEDELAAADAKPYDPATPHSMDFTAPELDNDELKAAISRASEEVAHSSGAHAAAVIADTREYTGGSVSYYQIDVLHPTTPGRDPYVAECNDVIEALGMSYAEGEAFKALWRMCAARQGKSKRGYDTAKYDAEKVIFYGNRILGDIVTPKGKKA